MTRILLPTLIGLMAILAGIIVVPIAFREQFKRWDRRREIEEWARDVR